jgi:hypothetical protein
VSARDEGEDVTVIHPKEKTMRRLVASVAAVVAALAVVASASAGHPTTGSPIRLLDPAATPATYTASTPFFVRHGFVCLPEERSLCLDPRTEFRLYIDGERMSSTLVLRLNVTCTDGAATYGTCSNRASLSNFPAALPAGPHAFRGEWWVSGKLTIVREATIDFVG